MKSSTLTIVRLPLQRLRKNKNACVIRHHGEEAAVEEVVRPLVGVMRETSRAVEPCLRQSTGTRLVSMTSRDCRIGVHQGRQAHNRHLPSVQVPCLPVLEVPIPGSPYLVSQEKTQVRPAGRVHLQLRKRRKIKKTRKLQRMLSGRPRIFRGLHEPTDFQLVPSQALILENRRTLPRPLPHPNRRSSSQRKSNDRSHHSAKRRRRTRRQRLEVSSTILLFYTMHAYGCFRYRLSFACEESTYC